MGLIKDDQNVSFSGTGEGKDSVFRCASIVREVTALPSQDVVGERELRQNGIVKGGSIRWVRGKGEVHVTRNNLFKRCLGVKITDGHSTVIVDREQRCITTIICNRNAIVGVEDQVHGRRCRSLAVMFTGGQCNVLELTVEAYHGACLNITGCDWNQFAQTSGHSSLRSDRWGFN